MDAKAVAHVIDIAIRKIGVKWKSERLSGHRLSHRKSTLAEAEFPSIERLQMNRRKIRARCNAVGAQPPDDVVAIDGLVETNHIDEPTHSGGRRDDQRRHDTIDAGEPLGVRRRDTLTL